MENNKVGNEILLVARVTRDMRRYVEGCGICQRMKNRTEKVAEKLKLSEVLEKP